MRDGEEYDLRQGHFYDPSVRGFDSYFLLGDTADLLLDTVKGRIKIGDTGLVGSASSIPQFLYGDFEFKVALDSLSPDSNDSVKQFGLRNIGDTQHRGAAYFDLGYDTTAGDSSPTTRPLAIVCYDEQGNRQRKHITWDTDWGGIAAGNRFRIRWESDGYTFLVNDSVVGILGDKPDGQTATNQINTTIPQAIRLSNRSLDTTDSSVTSLIYLNIRNSRTVNWRERL